MRRPAPGGGRAGCAPLRWAAALALSLALASPAALGQEAPGEVACQVLAARARLALHVQDLATGRRLLADALDCPAQPPEEIERLLDDQRRLQRRLTVHRRRLGVLLPLSGPYAAIGQAVERGLRAAFEGRGGPTLEVADTQGSPEGAALAAERLILERGVIALLGPVGDQESRAAAQRASELETPLLCLAAAEDLPSIGPWVFRHRIGPEDQARAIAQHALRDLGLRRFALLFPDDPYGRAMARAFWDEVKRGGGEVRGAESYPAQGDATDGAVRRLVGGFYPKARPDPFELRGAKDKQVAFQPIVDFDALFVPDGPQRARSLLAQVNYYGVRLLGTARGERRGHSHSPVQVLGPGSWNTRLLAQTAEPALQGARFPGALILDSGRPAVRAFVESFRARHGRPPGELEAQAHDAAGWMWLAWQSGSAEGRVGVQRALLGTPGFLGATGAVRVEPDGGTRTALTILSLRGPRLVPVFEPGDGRGAQQGGRPTGDIFVR